MEDALVRWRKHQSDEGHVSQMKDTLSQMKDALVR